MEKDIAQDMDQSNEDLALEEQQEETISSHEEEIEELNEKLLRALAESQTLRRRLNKEVDEAKLFAISKFSEALLGVADSLERALSSMPQEMAGMEGIKGFVEGIQLTERTLVKAFESYNIVKLVPLGQKLDPDLHQALFETPNSEVEPGVVLQVIQPGYILNSRLLRPALVEVAKKP
jgi:molecular chaperone GrpE